MEVLSLAQGLGGGGSSGGPLKGKGNNSNSAAAQAALQAAREASLKIGNQYAQLGIPNSTGKVMDQQFAMMTGATEAGLANQQSQVQGLQALQALQGLGGSNAYAQGYNNPSQSTNTGPSFDTSPGSLSPGTSDGSGIPV